MQKLEKRWAGREPTEQMLIAAEAWDMIHRPLRTEEAVVRHGKAYEAMMSVPEVMRDADFWNEYRLAFRRWENARLRYAEREGVRDKVPVKPNRRDRLAAAAQLRKAK